MKKVASLILALLLIAPLAACGGNPPVPSPEEDGLIKIPDFHNLTFVHEGEYDILVLDASLTIDVDDRGSLLSLMRLDRPESGDESIIPFMMSSSMDIYFSLYTDITSEEDLEFTVAGFPATGKHIVGTSSVDIRSNYMVFWFYDGEFIYLCEYTGDLSLDHARQSLTAAYDIIESIRYIGN